LLSGLSNIDITAGARAQLENSYSRSLEVLKDWWISDYSITKPILVDGATHLPFISFMPLSFKNLITNKMFHDVLQWDCTLQKVTRELKNSGFKILGFFHYGYTLKLKPLTSSYFIIAMKKRDKNNFEK